MTDPATSYEQRDRLRAANHDAIQATLPILHEVLRASHAAREAAAARDTRIDAKIDKQDAKIDRLTEVISTLSDQLRAADRSLSERLTRAEIMRSIIRVGSGVAAAVATVLVAALQFVVAPIIDQFWGG